MLPLEAVTLLGQRATPLDELGEADRLGLVGVDQPPIGTGEPVEPCPDLPLGRVRARGRPRAAGPPARPARVGGGGGAAPPTPAAAGGRGSVSSPRTWVQT